MTGPLPDPAVVNDAAGTAGKLAGNSTNTYDAVPYSVGAYPQTRPDRLATIARLFGMTPAHPSKCRVLELGCAAGGNVIPMALAAPQSQFTGVDLSQRQIDDARRTASAIGLRNCDLRALSILDLDDDLGTFDYILCHGVFSWVPPEVQEKILSICSRHLAPQGVAYISYNCYPGWHARGAIREMLWYHTERLTDPADRVRAARGLLAFLLQFAPANATGGFGALIKQELALLLVTPDTYLLHEHLEEFNEPLYFHQFASRAAAKGLRYLAEANIGSMLASKFGPDAEQLLRQISPDLLHMEQYMDFMRNAMFRQTLLCHADVPLDHKLRPEAVTDLYVASTAKPTNPDIDLRGDAAAEFKGTGDHSLTTRHPLMKSAMLTLADRAPMPIQFGTLVDAARSRLGDVQPLSADAPRDLATRLLNCHLSGLVSFSVAAPDFTVDVSARPVASPYARLRAKEGGKVVNLLLERVDLEPSALLLLQHLDGQHDHAALTATLADWIRQTAMEAKGVTAAEPAPQPQPPVACTAELVSELLKTLARHALLIA